MLKADELKELVRICECAVPSSPWRAAFSLSHKQDGHMGAVVPAPQASERMSMPQKEYAIIFQTKLHGLGTDRLDSKNVPKSFTTVSFRHGLDASERLTA